MPHPFLISLPVRVRLAATLVALIATTGLLAAPHARASDNFVLDNQTPNIVFDQFSIDLYESGCWYGQSGAFSYSEPQNQGEYSVVIGDAGLGCENRSWDVALSYKSGSQTIGALGFKAHDPFIGASSLECGGEGAAFEEGNSVVPIERFLTTEVDEDECKVRMLPGIGPGHTDLASIPRRAYAGHVRLVSSLAQVSRGKARVMVEVFGLGDARRRVTVALRDSSGRPIGEAARVLSVGDHPRTISVPLSPAMLATVRTRHELRIRAAVDISSPGGTGDTTTQLLLSTRR